MARYDPADSSHSHLSHRNDVNMSRFSTSCLLQVPIEEPPTGDDLAVVMYTSGSTGVPKGVLISHRNITSMIKSAVDEVAMTPEDRYIGYLPLAHIMELVCECACLASGVAVGYSSALTLSDQVCDFEDFTNWHHGPLTIFPCIPVHAPIPHRV